MHRGGSLGITRIVGASELDVERVRAKNQEIFSLLCATTAPPTEAADTGRRAPAGAASRRDTERRRGGRRRDILRSGSTLTTPVASTRGQCTRTAGGLRPHCTAPVSPPPALGTIQAAGGRGASAGSDFGSGSGSEVSRPGRPKATASDGDVHLVRGNAIAESMTAVSSFVSFRARSAIAWHTTERSDASGWAAGRIGRQGRL